MTSSTDDSRAASSAPRGTSNGTRSFGERPLGADDALRDRRLGDEKRARDLVGRQAAEQPQRQRDARLGRQHRMARGEHQPQQVVADVVVERGVEIRRGCVLLALRARGRAPRACARAACCGGSDRSRDAWRRPSARRRDCRGTPDSGHCSSAATSASCARSSASPTSRTMRVEAGDEPRRLDSPDRVDRAMGVGSRHGYRSHHLHARRATAGRSRRPQRQPRSQRFSTQSSLRPLRTHNHGHRVA